MSYLRGSGFTKKKPKDIVTKKRTQGPIPRATDVVQTVYMLAALAALAFNMPLVFLEIDMIFGLGSGVTSVIARQRATNISQTMTRSTNLWRR